MAPKKSALEYALYLLGYRARSRKELSQRLSKRGYGEEQIEYALERLSLMGYLDEKALAESLSRQAQETKFLGLSGARAYLARMGVPIELARKALQEYDESSGAIKMISKKNRSMKGLPSEVKKRRLYGALSRRGFSVETIRKALKTFREEDEA